jgi:hypothetical protein
MRRVLILAASLFLLLLTQWAYGQRGAMRGGGHSGGFGGHGVVGPRGGSAFTGMHGGFRSGALSRFEGIASFHRGSFRGGFRHRCFGCRRFGFPWWYGGYGYSGYYDPFWWDSFYSDDYRFDEQQAREVALANEMNRLNLEEQRLRYREDALDRQRDEDAYVRRDQPREQASSQPAPATVLVFRDQHRQEVQNYAISGQTLWVLTDQHAKKVPLTDLDLEATRKVNDDRGVEFELPR